MKPTKNAPPSALPTLTKADLVGALLDALPLLGREEAKETVEEVFALMEQTLASGRDIKITGLGSFEVREKSPRPGRNPRTGELVPIAARRVVTFHASTKCRAALQMEPI